MRLLIDTVNVGSPGGQQNQVEIAQSAERRCLPGWDVVVARAPGGMGFGGSDRLRELTVQRPAGGWAGMWRWFHRDLPRLAARHRADIVYSLSGILSGPLRRRFGTVNSINNMLPFTPLHLRHFPPLSKDRLRLEILRRLYVRGCIRADAVVFPSAHGLERVRAYAKDLAEKSYVAYNPVPSYVAFDPARPPRHPYGGAPYFFYLSVVFWYKNHLNLIEAYRRLLCAGHSLPDLIMAGPPTDADYVRKIQQAIAAGSLGSKVRYLGTIPRDDIPSWLHHATANVFPSTCETNSFVQGEILGAHGVMACSNVPPMPEIAGEAAELFDPFDPDSIGRALLRLCSDEGRRRQLRALAAKRAAEFTQDACGEVLWKAVLRAEEVSRARRSSARIRVRGAA